MPTSAPPPGAEAIARLAEFSAALAYEDLPGDVVAKARVHLLDTLGAAFAGTRSREFGQVLATIEPRADGAAGIWGSDLRASVRDAALVNGVAAHVFELDDTGGCDHSGAVVVPALMAAAEGRAVSGREFLTAFVVGYEVGRRVLEASGGYDRHNGAGWHSTGTCGAIAAAAAASTPSPCGTPSPSPRRSARACGPSSMTARRRRSCTPAAPPRAACSPRNWRRRA
jgi:2-methylcitrate dehydratase PrpD